MSGETGYMTMMPGLDGLLLSEGLLLSGGKNLIMLIKGRPGCGKTTLSLQLVKGICLPDYIDDENRSRYFISLEQVTEDLAKRLGEVGEDSDHLVNFDIQCPHHGVSVDSPLSTTSPTLDRLNGVVRWLSGTDRRDIGVMAVDGLNLLNAQEREISDLERLIVAMRMRCGIGILVYESGGDTYSSIDYHCDFIIEMRGDDEAKGGERYYLNRLRIAKARFQKTGLGWHQYKIRKEGITVYPSIHFRLSRHKTLDDSFRSSLDRITKITAPEVHCAGHETSLISCILGPEKLKRASCTVLLGPRRSLKTQLTFDFLRAGSIGGDHGLLISLIDNQGTIAEERKTLCEIDCKKRPECERSSIRQVWCYENVYLFHFPPGCLTSSEFFDSLERRLVKSEELGSPIRRMVFWDLAQLAYRFPLLGEDSMFLPGLMDYLKYSKRSDSGEERGISSVFMGASNDERARAASAMADNVIFCWQEKRKADSGVFLDGVAVYVDRIEGNPSDNRLLFLRRVKDNPEESLSQQVAYQAKSSIDDVLDKLTDNARKKIEEIQKLQGL